MVWTIVVLLLIGPRQWLLFPIWLLSVTLLGIVTERKKWAFKHFLQHAASKIEPVLRSVRYRRRDGLANEPERLTSSWCATCRNAVVGAPVKGTDDS